MRQRFADTPEALANTLAIAEACTLELKFGKPLLPEFPLPPEWPSPEDYLRHLVDIGLRDRFQGGVSTEQKERAAYELGVICRMGFASYFLIVRDFIVFAREHGIGVGPGRGSVAGSLVAYALRITDVDPLEHALIFERFLNPERVTMPDIDIDFDDLRRGEVIDYVRRKYGDGNVTQIITFGTMGAKGVVRDVGRALGSRVRRGRQDREARARRPRHDTRAGSRAVARSQEHAAARPRVRAAAVECARARRPRASCVDPRGGCAHHARVRSPTTCRSAGRRTSRSRRSGT
jgi:DNA polymerase III alpha subunit